MVAKGRTRAHNSTQGFGHGGHDSRVREREMRDNQISVKCQGVNGGKNPHQLKELSHYQFVSHVNINLTETNRRTNGA
jgi:hypothetical protein